MAFRIPSFADLPEVNPRSVGTQPSYPQDDPVATATAIFGKGLTAVGAAASNIADEQEYKRQKLNEATATADLYNRLVPLHSQVAIETDPGKLTELRGQYNALLETSGNAIDDPLRRKMWVATHSKTIANAHADADKRHAELGRHQAATDIRTQLDDVVRTTAGSADSMALPNAQAIIGEKLKWAREYGALSPEQEYTLKKHYQGQLIGGTVNGLINRNRADEAIGLLDRHTGDIDPIAAERFRARAEHAKEKQGVAADIAAETGVGLRDKGYTGDRGAVVQMQQGATRNLPIATTLNAQLERAASAVGDLKVEVFSGGQPSSGANRTGSHRHDDGGAGDVQLRDVKTGQLLDMRKPEDRARMGRFITAAVSAGATGVGAAEDYMGPHGLHIGGGEPSVWGAGGKGPNAPEWVRTAYQAGRSGAAGTTSPTDAAAIARSLASLMGAAPPGGPAPTGKPIPGGKAGSDQDPGLQAEIDAAPQSGEVIPLDQTAGMSPMFDVNASMQRTQARVDRGEISQERANAVNAGVLGWHNQVQARQASERAAVTKRLSSGAAMLEDGREFEYDPAEVRHFFPKEKADDLLTVLQDAKESGQVMNGVRMASQADLVQQEQEITKGLADPNAENYARRRKHATAFYSAVEKRQKAIGTDPAGYVAQFSPEVSTKYAAIGQAKPEERSAFFANYAATALSEQERLGVSPENRSVLPASEAAQVASRISRLDPAKEDPAKALAGLASHYGDYWEPAFGDLVRAKLPGTYQVLATMTEKDQAVPAADLSQAIKLIAEKGGMSALKKSVPDDKQKAIDKELDTALEDFRESTGQQVGGVKLYATVRDAVQSLAYYNAFRGQSETQAVRSAVDGIINAKYDFGSLGAGQVRVPKGSLGIVERATDAAKAAFTVDQLGDIPGNELLSPEQRKGLWADAIRAGGWVNNRDDTGVTLMGRFRNGAFHAVRRDDGSRIEVKFADAPALAKEAPDVPAVVLEGVQQGLRRPRSPAPSGTVLGAP